MRLIDADALMVSKQWGNCICPAQVIHNAPTIDPETLRPTGRWECIKDQCNENPVYKCYKCGQEVVSSNGTNIQKALKYCPNCGAKMMEG